MPPRNPDTRTSPPLPLAYDLEAERTALGAIIVASPPWAEVEAAVSASDFYDQRHRAIFRACASTSNGIPLDLSLLGTSMRTCGDDPDGETTRYLWKLTDGVPRSKNWQAYILPVLQLARERRRVLLAQDYAACQDGAKRATLLAALNDAESEVQAAGTIGLPWVDLSVKPEPGRWLVRSVIPEQGRLLLVAPSGTGKSWILEDLALSVVLGDPWLDVDAFGIQGNRGPVMIIDEESAWRRIHYRLSRLAAARNLEITDLQPNLQLCCLAGVNVGDPRTWGLLLSEVRAKKPSLVILDAAIRIISGDENKAEVVGAFWRAIGALQQHGAAVAVAHHTGWSEEGRSRGSTDFHGGADVVLVLSKTDEKDRVKMSWKKMKDPPDSMDPDPIYIKREGREQVKLSCDGSAADDKAMGDALDDAVLAALADREFTRKDLLEYMPQNSRAAVDRAVKRLRDIGQIVVKGKVYRLAF